MLPLFMSVSFTLTNKCFITLSTFEVIFTCRCYRQKKDFTKYYNNFLKRKSFIFERNFLTRASHYKQNRTYLKNKRRPFNAVT